MKDMAYGVRQFLMTDPGGNIIRIGQPVETKAAQTDMSRSRLEKALDAAVLLAHSKGDPETAARVIDSALADTPDAPAALLVSARILRADTAVAMGEDQLAATLLDDAARVTLSADDRTALADELARAQDLRRVLAGG